MTLESFTFKSLLRGKSPFHGSTTGKRNHNIPGVLLRVFDMIDLQVFSIGRRKFVSIPVSKVS